MRTKIVKWGNSLGLRIPKSFAEEIAVGEGSAVDLRLVEGQLVVSAVPPEYTLDELLAEVDESNLHPETDTGDAVGDEAW